MKYRILIFLIILSTSVFAQEELPQVNYENTFYILPIYEVDVLASLAEEREAQYLKMKNELGVGNLYHRLGFSFIYNADFESAYHNEFKWAKENGLHLGLIFAFQSHTRNNYRAIADTDLRQYQWRLDGEDWKGSFTSTGELEVPEDERDYKVPTPSRYATQLRDYNFNTTKRWAKSVLGLMEKYPGVIANINGPIEEELVIGGIDILKLSDYSPYAITEFRDWLRHSGIYDAAGGAYAGEGAIALIIGDLIDFNGTPRSQFYDDPTPDNNNGTGASFNDFFGTTFQTWSLKYWDLTIYTDPITDEDFDVSPESGDGYCAQGFDAPRVLDAANPFWNAWSYDIPDHGGAYPPGSPAMPAYGFRQNMVRNFVRDLFDVLADEGISREIMHAHQIPGETLGDFTGEAERNRSSASTIWTGYLEKSQTVGITKFGIIDPTLLTQYADDWGIFEWHPLPFAIPASQQLYDASTQSLNSYYANKCHVLYPGWWSAQPPPADEIFPLNDSKFSEAIGDFMRNRDEIPYHQQGNTFTYSPPQVNGVSGSVNSGELKIEWDSTIWSGLIAEWEEWSEFDFFEVQWSPDGLAWGNADTTVNNHLVVSVDEDAYQLRVRVNATSGLLGPWSEVVSVGLSSEEIVLQITPKYSSLYFDTGIRNPIVIKAADPNHILALDSLEVSIVGDGISLNTTPVGVENIEKFWPMNSIEEMLSYNGLTNVENQGGIFSASVSSVAPVDPYFHLNESELNGAVLPYISLRMYSSENTTGELFWFYNGGFSSIDFNVQQGWHIYQIDHLPEWISVEQITNVRLDPSALGNVQIMVDWFAIGSQPISDQLEDAIYMEDQQAIIMTSPFGQAGSYTATVNYRGASNFVTIETSLMNEAPSVSLLLPAIDTAIEIGTSINLEAFAMDTDGVIRKLRFLANGVLITELLDPPFSYQWTPESIGVFHIKAEAYDNTGAAVVSPSTLLDIFAQTPLGGIPHQVPGIIEAEDYDLGGALIAYWDSDLGNQGAVYRDDDVDIDLIPNEPGQYYLGWTENNEWLEYTIDVEESTKMEFIVKTAATEDGGELHFEINGERITNNLFIGSTGGDQHYEAYKIEDIYLTEGVQKLKLFIDRGGVNINHIEIKKYDDTHTVVTTEVSNDALLLYPNPVKNELRFHTGSTHLDRIELWSTTGQLIKKHQLDATQISTINVADLAAGVYIVNVISDNQSWVGKIIKL